VFSKNDPHGSLGDTNRFWGRSARPDILMAHLAVAHRAIGQADVFAGGGRGSRCSAIQHVIGPGRLAALYGSSFESGL
jgi:hypothetical protein